MLRRVLAIAVAAGGLLLTASPALAQHQPPPLPTNVQEKLPPRRVMPLPGLVPPSASGRRPTPMPPGGGHAGPVAPHPLHAGGGEGSHGGAHEGGHDGPPKPINWWHGFLGKKEGVEPSLLWRTPEEDAPYLAALLNFAVFAWVIVRFGKKPLQESLSKRKHDIMRDIDAAQKMRKDAETRLQEYEQRLEKIDTEIERIRNDFRDQGERDRERIVKDAEEKRDRMLKDAQFLIEQESRQLRVVLTREAVDAAVAAAEQVLRSRITADDHDRLAEQFIQQLAASRGTAPTRGGNA